MAKGICQPNEKVRNGWELLLKDFELLSHAEAPLPMGIVDKVGVDFDTRLDNHLNRLQLGHYPDEAYHFYTNVAHRL